MKRCFCLFAVGVFLFSACTKMQMPLTEEDAIAIVSEYLKKDCAEYDIEPPFDGIQEFRNEKLNRMDYHLVHAYAIGNCIDGDIRTSGTIGWFYVNRFTGKLFVDYGTSVLEEIS